MTDAYWETIPTDTQRDHGIVVELWCVIMRRKQLFIIVSAIVLATGAAVTLLWPKSYTGLATIVVPPAATDPLQPATEAGVDRLDDDKLQTEAAFLQSRDVAAAVIANVGYRIAPSPMSVFLCAHVPVLCNTRTKPVTPDGRIDLFLRNLTVLPEDHSRVLDLSFNATDPEQAAVVANTIVTVYQGQALAEQALDLNRTVGWLDVRASELRGRWLDAVRAASKFRVENGISQATDAMPALGDSQVAQAATSLGEAQARLAAAQARQAEMKAAVSSGDAASIAGIGAQPIVVQQSAALSMLLAQRAQMAAQLGASHPDLAAIDHQVASARESLGAATGSAVRSVTNDLASASAEVAQLRSGLQGMQGDAGRQVLPLVQYHTLEQEAESAQSVYQTFLTRQTELANRTTILRPPISFVSHAEVPNVPSAPKRLRLALASVLLAIVAGAASAFLAEHIAAGFADGGELRTTLRLPLLSVIPIADGSRKDLRGLLLRQPFTRLAESVRALAIHLALTDEGEAGQAVLICSADAGEGKTTLALWLPEIIGDTSRVVVIDGDHRQGGASAQLLPAGGPGLTELLSGKAALADVLHRDPKTGVDFISCGAQRSRSLSRNEMDRLRDLLTTLKQSHRLVLVDSPPLRGTSDALIYAKLAERTVFVCRWRETSRDAVTSSIERLRDVGAHIAGVVLSMADLRSAMAYGGAYADAEAAPLRRLA